MVVEVLSSGGENERRDKEVKLKLYSSRGVQEYWIVDWQKQQIEVYRREKAALHLKVTLFANDELTSPLLANLQIPVRQIFA
nr:Uma2 family endonuclease [Chroococcidiopsis sp. TS-821]